MPNLDVDGRNIALDEDGYLVSMDDWNEKVARVLAKQEGIEELTDDRMAIIRFLRDYYKQYNYFPILESVCLHVHQPGKCIKHEFIHPLSAWKIAGLPKPPDVVLAYLNFGQVPT
jgi:TusE/DsrC/DsvC family sulfur relay protein